MRIAKDESGFTLVETLVALGIFLSVTLPLITVLGNFLADPVPDVRHNHLLLCEEEFSLLNAVETGVHDTLKVLSGNYRMSRKAERVQNTEKVTLAVYKENGKSRPDTTLMMCKYFLR